MRMLFNFLKGFCKHVAYFILGLLFLSGVIIYTILSLPVYLYRWMVTKVLAPLCKRELGKAVTAVSAAFATELIQDESRNRPRAAIVINVALEGSLTPEKARNIVQDGLINLQHNEGEGGGLKYPELQQYISTWMGYMFWKQDKTFNVQNHLIYHHCGQTWTDEECEQFALSIVEDLLNTPFPKKRSPWEVHLIHGYKNSSLSSKREMTVVASRFHHCVADGFSLLSMLCEGILGRSIADCGIGMLAKAPPSSSEDGPFRGKNKTRSLAAKIKSVSLPIRAIYDIGYGTSILLFPTQTPWFIPESKQTGRQLYDRSEYLSVSKIKLIKNKLGVSFTAVLLSSIAAGIASAFKSKGYGNHIKSLPFGSPIPRNVHPNKLRNHVTGTLYELPIDQTLSHLQRLIESEKQIQVAKQSGIPVVIIGLLKLFASQIPSVAKFLLTNRVLSTVLSSFPGPGIKLGAHGLTAVSTDFAAGLQLGVCGVGFMTLSYCDEIRIAVVAESAAMSRQELKELIRRIHHELNTLYGIAMEEENSDVKVVMK